MMSHFRNLFVLPAACIFFVAGPARAEKSIVETAVDAGAFQTLVAAVQAAGLVDTLIGPGPFTVFAPTDEAFAKLPGGTVETLLKPENKAQLVKVLTYHVVAGRVAAADVVKLSGAKTVEGQRVKIVANDAGVSVNQASVVQTDILCSNGIIHVVDSVLLPVSETIPEVAAAAGEFATLLAAADAAGLVPVLSGEGPLTVFAPTDEAFKTLPKGTVANLLKPENRSKLAEILKYHVVAGRVYSEDAIEISSAPTVAGPSISIIPTDSGANINNAKLISTDIDAANGVIHVIDRVLLPSDAPTQVTMSKPKVGSQRGVARSRINEAIQQGVPMFNGGDHHGCARVYMQALQSVASMNDCGLSDQSLGQINSTIQSCQQMHSATDRAWALRSRMDQIMIQL